MAMPVSADYAAPGSLAHSTFDVPAGAGGATGGKLVVPDGPGPYPLVVASHGWSATADNQVGWAEHFAGYGFVVVAPTFPNNTSPDAQKDAAIIEALVALYGDSSTASPARGKVDPARVGLEGHSAGGLATTIASAKLHPGATVLFDPVDASGVGQAAYATICSPVMGIFASPGACNNNAGWSAFKATTSGPQILFNVVGSTHCDGENNPRSLCGPFCGGAADPTRQSKYARNATAYLLSELTGDVNATASIAQAKLQGDTGLAGVVMTSAPSCTGTGVDAGASDAAAPADASNGKQPDASSADAGHLGDASPGPPDTGGPSPAGEAPPSGSTTAGCGCSFERDGRAGAASSMLVAGLLVSARLRRRRAGQARG